MSKLLIDRLVLGAYQTNAYLLRREGSSAAVVIDPGDDVPALDEALNRFALRPEAVLLTHGHFDHLLGAHHIKQAYGARVYIGEADAPALTEEKISLRPADALTLFEPTPPDGLLTEGECEFAGIRFRVIPAPGHTMGGVCLLAEDDGMLFTGDTLFAGGFGRTDLYGGDWTQLYHSLKRLLALDGTLFVLPGHGEGSTLDAIKRGFHR